MTLRCDTFPARPTSYASLSPGYENFCSCKIIQNVINIGCLTNRFPRYRTRTVETMMERSFVRAPVACIDGDRSSSTSADKSAAEHTRIVSPDVDADRSSGMARAPLTKPPFQLGRGMPKHTRGVLPHP